MARKSAKDVSDTPILMSEFQSVMLATMQTEAESNYHEALSSATSKKYLSWCSCLQDYWGRKERWCVAWRPAVHRGHHTNNYSEVTVRLFKDISCSGRLCALPWSSITADDCWTLDTLEKHCIFCGSDASRTMRHTPGVKQLASLRSLHSRCQVKQSR